MDENQTLDEMIIIQFADYAVERVSKAEKYALKSLIACVVIGIVLVTASGKVGAFIGNAITALMTIRRSKAGIIKIREEIELHQMEKIK